MTRMSGVPRNMSVYAIASQRSGAAPRPGRPRTIASIRANTSTSASATSISSRLSLKPVHTAGTERRKSSGPKNSCRKWPIPTSSVPRPRLRLLQDRDAVRVVALPLLGELADRSVRLQRPDRLVHERDQRTMQLEDGAVPLVGVDLSDDAAVGARFLGGLRLDDRRVEDQGLARTGLHRVERGARRRRVLE